MLPAEAYFDDGWFQREREMIFERHWTLVASVDEIATGGAIDVRVGRYPLLLVRAEEGLRAFHNLCRHRGMTLIAGAETVGDLVRCPYHGWEFRPADGALVRIPQRGAQFPDAEQSALGLFPAAVAEWEGMVFVHPDPDADPFEDAIAGFAEALGSFRPGRLRQLAHVRIDVSFNWKLFVENHIDVYHLWYLHAATLADFDHPRFEHRQLGPNWVSYEPLRHLPNAPEAHHTSGISHLDHRDRNGLGAHLIFPNITMASTADYFVTYAARPTGPTSAVIDLRVRGEDETRVADMVSSARSFIDEDIAACDRIQAAVQSPRFEVGPLARTHEAPIVAFHDHLLELLAGAPTPVSVRRVPA